MSHEERRSEQFFSKRACDFSDRISGVWLGHDHLASRARQRVSASIIYEFPPRPNASGWALRPFAICGSGPVRVRVLERINDRRQTTITRALLSICEHLASGTCPDRACLFGFSSGHFRVVPNDSHVHWCRISVRRVDFTLVSEGWHTQAKVGQHPVSERVRIFASLRQSPLSVPLSTLERGLGG
jgi:hypothetical protein